MSTQVTMVAIYVNVNRQNYVRMYSSTSRVYVIVRVYLSLSSRLRDLREQAKPEPVVS